MWGQIDIEVWTSEPTATSSLVLLRWRIASYERRPTTLHPISAIRAWTTPIRAQVGLHSNKMSTSMAAFTLDLLASAHDVRAEYESPADD